MWSGINNALLLDSGWYELGEVVPDEHIIWGKGKGCDFIDKYCKGNFSEFCYNKDEDIVSFDF